jgi:hypothetical protein
MVCLSNSSAGNITLRCGKNVALELRGERASYMSLRTTFRFHTVRPTKPTKRNKGKYLVSSYSGLWRALGLQNAPVCG